MNESYESKSKEISVGSNMMKACRAAALVVAGIVLAAVLTKAQTSTAGQIQRMTATIDNLSGAHESIRIDVLQWSTDAERDHLVSAWMLNSAPATQGHGAGDPGAGAAAAVPDPAVNGRSGRGARGAVAETPRTPESSLMAALGKAPVVGYLWSSEVAGYGLHYAVRLLGSDGGERIILITDRRLGVWNDL